MLTNLCKLACVVSLFVGVAGCGNDTTMNAVDDLSMSMVVHDLAQPTTGGDMAKSNADGGHGTDGGNGLLALCATCTMDNQCASGACLPYAGGTTKKCSHTCTPAMASTDCPGINMCNGMNICKCP